MNLQRIVGTVCMLNPPPGGRGYTIGQVLQVARSHAHPKVGLNFCQIKCFVITVHGHLQRHRILVAVKTNQALAKINSHPLPLTATLQNGQFAHGKGSVCKLHRVHFQPHRSALLSVNHPRIVREPAFDCLAHPHKSIFSLQQDLGRSLAGLSCALRVPDRHPGGSTGTAQHPPQRVSGQNHFHHWRHWHATLELALVRLGHPVLVGMQPVAISAHQHAVRQVHQNATQVIADVMHAGSHQHPVQRVQLQVKADGKALRHLGQHVQNLLPVHAWLFVERSHQPLAIGQVIGHHHQMPAFQQMRRDRVRWHHHRLGQIRLQAWHPCHPIERCGRHCALAIENH